MSLTTIIQQGSGLGAGWGVSSGGSSPALPVNGVQFNSAGAFGGDSKFLWDNVAKALTVGQSVSVGAGVTIGPSGQVRSNGGTSGYPAGIDIAGQSVLLFYAGKSAFRAMYQSVSGYMLDLNIGMYSAAFGRDCSASAQGSFVAGYLNQNTGSNSVAFGSNSSVWDHGSGVLGEYNVNAGIASFALGYGNNVGFGTASIAIGYGNNVSAAVGFGACAIGNFCQCTNQRAIVIGESSIASGIASYAYGFAVESSGVISFGIGKNVKSSHDGAVVIGAGYGAGVNRLASTSAGRMSVGMGSQLATFEIDSGTSGLAGTMQILGTLFLPNLDTFATNVLALAAGLIAGQVYKTITGELRVVV